MTDKRQKATKVKCKRVRKRDNMRSGSIFVSLWDYVRENVWELLKLGLISGCKRDESKTVNIPGIYVVVQFYPRFKFYFPLFWGMIMIMSLKQGEIKFKPRIKLHHNIFLFEKSIWVLVELVRSGTQNFTIIDQEKRKIKQICIWNPMTTGFTM